MLTSFPLYGAGRLAGNVQRHAVDAGHLVDDAVADLLQQVVGESGPVCGHRVVGGDSPDDDGVGVGPRVAHDADGVDRRQYGEALPQLAVEACVSYLVLQHGVGLAKNREPLCRDVPYDPDREPWPGERLPPDEPFGHPELRRNDAYLVLEEVPQRLDEVEVHNLGEAAHVVVTLYPGGVARPALYDVGVERALHKESGVLEFVRLLLEGADELLTDDLALRLGVRDVSELVQETSRRVYVDERHVRVLAERLDDLLGLIVSQETVGDEDARQIVADGPVDEHRRRRRIDPAGEPADGPCVAYLFSYPLDSVGNDVDRRPLGPAAAGLVEEVLEHLHPVLCVPDLGLELDPEAPLFGVLERDNWNRGCLGSNLETFRYGEDSVSVASPGLLLVGRAGEEALVAIDDQVRATVLPDLDSPHFPALNERHELHPVTDAEHRRVQVEEPLPHPRCIVLVDAVGSAREDDALGVFGPYLFYGRVVRNHLRVDAAFPDAASDQLRVLPAEIEYQDQVSSASQINSTATETFRSVHPRRCKRTQCQHRRS